MLNKEIYNDFELLLLDGNPVMIRSYFRSYSNNNTKNFFANLDEIADKVLVWGHYFFINYLREESPAFHRELIKSFFSGKNEYNAAPRGFSKTTVIQLCMAYSIAHNLDKFIVLIEKTFYEASEVIKGVHDEFLQNERILKVYGQMVGKMPLSVKVMRNSIENKKKKVESVEARKREAMGDVFINGVRIRGKGFNTTIRGLKSGEWRPTRIILDDVEEDDHINNPEQRQKYRDNYDKGVQPAVDVIGSIKIYGTILHMDSLLKSKIDQHVGKIYRAHAGSDPATAPLSSFLWPERHSRERLIKKRNDMMSEGKSSNAYAQEFLNDPVSDEERTFKWDWLYENIPIPQNPSKRYNVPKNRMSTTKFNVLRKRTVLNGYGLIDSGDSTNSYSDWTGAVVVFVDPNNYWYVVSAERFKLNITDQLDIVFNMWKNWRSTGLISIGVEKKAFTDQFKPLLDPEKTRRQLYPVVEELKPMGRNKENRIRGALEGIFQSDKVIFVCDREEHGKWLVPEGMMALLEELYNFPSAKHDDLSDSLAYIEDVKEIPFENQREVVPHHAPVDDAFMEDTQNIGGTINDPGSSYE